MTTATEETITMRIADGLDALTDGRGYDASHHEAVKLANAAPALLAALKDLLKISRHAPKCASMMVVSNGRYAGKNMDDPCSCGRDEAVAAAKAALSAVE